MLTRGIVLIGEIHAVLGTGNEDTPEGAADFALSETGDVDLILKVPVLKRFGEIATVDTIIVRQVDQVWEVIMAIYTGQRDCL